MSEITTKQPGNMVCPKVFTIEGNIGAGKSTFLKLLNERLEIDAVFEPTNKWQQIGKSDNLLHLFYQDTKRWSYTFQSYAFISRIQTQVESMKLNAAKHIQVLERSIYCDRFCFAKNCYELGTMSALEWELYKEWFNWLASSHTMQPSGFIYLKTRPETCFERLRKRSRMEEEVISLSYLESLHEKHEHWLVHKEDIHGILSNVPVLTLEVDQEFETNAKLLDELTLKTKMFMEQVEASPACIS